MTYPAKPKKFALKEFLKLWPAPYSFAEDSQQKWEKLIAKEVRRAVEEFRERVARFVEIKHGEHGLDSTTCEADEKLTHEYCYDCARANRKALAEDIRHALPLEAEGKEKVND